MKFELLNSLIEKFVKFPGVGRKTAERYAFHVLDMKSNEVDDLVDSMKYLKERVSNCKQCNNLTEDNLCDICKNGSRDSSLLCVVEEPKDLMSIEKAGCFKGKYFVLLGALSPLDGVGIEDIKLNELFCYVKSNFAIKEIIISTDADAEGESTAHYIMKLLKPLGRKVSRIGMGLPVGADLEFIDRNTLQEAFKGRREIL
ncbi:MAG: recombination mediator RecR [Candidatus Kaelpia aquatica]|nr:recombination mediator RecR [Candidatus Kaelpia aquatica]